MKKAYDSVAEMVADLDEPEMNETKWEKIKYAYWRHWPYDWRPHQIWYRLKCFLWHRYTTVKPRYLAHTWCDRDTLLAHMMFEILSDFIEKECSPGHVEWYGEHGHKIEVAGEEKYVRDEMQDLYDWWHVVCQTEYPEVDDLLWAEANKHRPTRNLRQEGEFSVWDPQFPIEEDKELWNNCVRATSKLEQMRVTDLQRRLHRLINVMPYMWT